MPASLGPASASMPMNSRPEKAMGMRNQNKTSLTSWSSASRGSAMPERPSDKNSIDIDVRSVATSMTHGNLMRRKRGIPRVKNGRTESSVEMAQEVNRERKRAHWRKGRNEVVVISWVVCQ